MKLKVGGKYKNRIGTTVLIVREDPNTFYPFVDNRGEMYTILGELMPGAVFTGDLVEEIHDEPPPSEPIAPETDYKPLQDVLDAAYAQAAYGKGNERHSKGEPFLEQPIMSITEAVGTGFPLGQALKKIQEASGMLNRGEIDAYVRELYGAIVYLAAAVLAVKR